MVAVNIEKLEELRHHRGLSKTALCRIVGIHPSTYTLILKRKRKNPATVKAIALALGLAPEKAWKKDRKAPDGNL